jgi:hypothetical protein
MSAIVLRPFLICLAINQVQDSGAMAFMHFYVVSKINFCPVLSFFSYNLLAFVSADSKIIQRRSI